ncbi:MAG: HAMP domain-containing histidine kinase, partial [Crenarchaeota archaeon]|nr:HAMP domain-containing histidine kinase [Thermoproteota archaeon]
EVQYANKIINDLLDYSREIKLYLKTTDVGNLIQDSLSTVDIPKDVQIKAKIEKNLFVAIDFDKMKRVCVNLIRNAIDAMPNGGKLEIKSQQKNQAVMLSFIDSGTGIPKATLDKLWTPFFTTKSKGIGLGLAICKRIVEAHEGKISIKSKLGKGTTFTITLPLVKK